MTESTSRAKEEKTKLMQELHKTTATIDGYFVSVIDSDISTFATYVEDASINFAPNLILNQVLRSDEKDRWQQAEQNEEDALYKHKTWSLVPKTIKIKHY